MGCHISTEPNYGKSSNVNKCPCRRWINCRYFNWRKDNKKYWLDRWRNERRYKEAHEKLNSIDFSSFSL